MDKQERLEKLKEAQEKITNEIEELKNEIEELKNEIENEKSKCWKPVNGETVWEWSYMFNVPITQVYSSGYAIQNNKYAMGELFPTKELCEEHHNEKVYKERWKRLSIESGENENPWDGIHRHWYVQYSTVDDRLNIDTHICSFDANVYFSSYEAVKNAIREIGEDNVERYVLGIKG